MRNFILFVIGVAAIYGGYIQMHSRTAPPEPGAAETVQLKAGAPKGTTAAADPVVPSPARLAPAGIVFLLDYVSIRTATGVIGLTPGTRMQIKEDRGQMLLLTDGTHTVEVSPRLVTNDLTLAGQVANADAAAQSQIAAEQKSSLEAARQHAAQLAATAAARVTPTPAAAVPVPTPKWVSPLDLGAEQTDSHVAPIKRRGR